MSASRLGPLLVDGEHRITQSLAIMEYLEREERRLRLPPLPSKEDERDE